MRLSVGLLLLLAAGSATAGDAIEYGGHTKFRLVGQSFSEDSLFHDTARSTALDAAGELRLNLSGRQAGWSYQADYQLIGLHSEFLPFGLPDDGLRLMDLTKTLHDGNEDAAIHRLDRLWLGYTGNKTVVRLGRQALSWGNGLFFSPMDLVNPFDPTTIDTEYKTGDDMLYTQYLRDNGHDLQAAAGIMGALIYHQSTGEGQVVEVSMQEAMSMSQETAMMQADILGTNRERGVPARGLGRHESDTAETATAGFAFDHVRVTGADPLAGQLRIVDRLGATEGAIMSPDDLAVLPAFQEISVGQIVGQKDTAVGVAVAVSAMVWGFPRR